MSRPGFRASLILLVLVFGPVATLQAQVFADDAADDNPLNAKAMAKRLREAQRTEPRELLRASHDAAKAAFEVRLQRIHGGTDLPDVTLDLVPKILAAELALADGRAGPLAALERAWVRSREIERLTEERVNAGVKNFTPADYWEVRTERLLAELRLVRELGGKGKPLSGAVLSSLPDVAPLDTSPLAREAFAGPQGAAPIAYAGLDIRTVAREALALTRAEPQALAREARTAPINAYWVRIQRIRGGTDTPDNSLHAAISYVRAVRAGDADSADLQATLEAYWQQVWEIEVLTQERIEAAVKNFTPADYTYARDHRLEAEVWMMEARGQPKQLRPLQGGLQSPLWELVDPLMTREYARAKFDAVRSDLRQLNLQRQQTLQASLAVREQRVRGGTDTPDVTLETARRLAAVELTLASNRAERLAALQRHWVRTRTIEDLTRQRVEHGVKNFTPADWLQARYERLQAELRLAEALAVKE
jgi:hypothetical protein